MLNLCNVIIVIAFEQIGAWLKFNEVVGAEDAQDIVFSICYDTLVPWTVWLRLLNKLFCDFSNTFGRDAFDLLLVVGLIDKIHCNRQPDKVNITDVSEQLCVIVCDFAETPLGIIVIWVKGGVADRRLN